ncbi:hypothetical protein [Pseudoalteromonas umbrosa]|uniref:hypothetical protein n=1 Tax=Pseudoalteromonas umbrosa TaxID=3048489 RepID=UPI0024C2E7C5|nr:hypothetical protein [Pseudoalteromonas sp. B95]MDK1289822.1 hypothetical protein [Pseudoalteromonas sp. B95]
MAVVLLGAGASFGSEEEAISTPPLGPSLFKELVKKGGVASELSEELKQKFEDDFEKGMEAYYEGTNKNIMTFQRELAEYLASFKPSDNNVYLDLIRELGNENVIYSSLNYDLLFELSVFKLGYHITYHSNYAQDDFCILKIHGSSNFWPNIPEVLANGFEYEGNGIGDINAGIKPVSQPETLHKCANWGSVAPAIAMFAVGKEVRVCNSYVEEQYAMWKAEVEKSSQIFIVGVRVHEVDEHIWSLLGRIEGDVTYFGFESDKAAFDRWKSTHQKKNADFVNSDFKNAVPIMKQRIRQ